MADGGPFEVVLVSAGPACCVLANRLTEDAGRTVALLEAGPDYGRDPAAWPAERRGPSVIAPDLHAWGHVHAGRPADRPLPLPCARVVGDAGQYSLPKLPTPNTTNTHNGGDDGVSGVRGVRDDTPLALAGFDQNADVDLPLGNGGRRHRRTS